MKQLYTQRKVMNADDSVLVVTKHGKMVGSVAAKEVMTALGNKGKQVSIKGFGFDRAHIQQFIKTWFSEYYHPTCFVDDMSALRACSNE